MSPEDQAEEQPVAQYKKLLACNSFLFVVFYRGHWCPFCMAYLNTLQALTSSIEGACGKVVAITAEPSEHITATRAASGYTGTLIVDEDNQLVKEMKSTAATDVAITERKGYAKGMAQPAVIVIKNSGEVVHSWAIVPSLVSPLCTRMVRRATGDVAFPCVRMDNR